MKKNMPLLEMELRNQNSNNKHTKVPNFVKFSLRKNPIQFLCVNDLMDHSQPESAIAKQELEKFYETIYPFKSEFEL